jgi:hypothetical protein
MLTEQLGEGLGVTELDDDLRALFETLHGISLEELEQDEMESARAEMEDMFAEMGLEVDLSGFHAGMSDEDVAAKAADMLDEVRRQAEAAQATVSPGRRKTKRQTREDKRTR